MWKILFIVIMNIVGAQNVKSNLVELCSNWKAEIIVLYTLQSSNWYKDWTKYTSLQHNESCTHGCTHIHTNTDTDTYTHSCMHALVHAHTHALVHTHTIQFDIVTIKSWEKFSTYIVNVHSISMHLSHQSVV